MKHRSILDRSIATRLSALCALAIIVGGGSQKSLAATINWDGGVGGTGTDLGVAANWTGDVIPNGTVPDIAQWNGTVAGPLSLTYTTPTANFSNSTGIGIVLTSAQTDSVSIDLNNGATNIWRIGAAGIVINAGAGAFTLGDGIGTGTITFGQSGNVDTTGTFTNNSANTATINSDVTINPGGSANLRVMAFGGTGNWTLNNVFTGRITLTKSGAGTLTMNADNSGWASTAILIGGVSYTRTIQASAGTLVVGHANALGGTGKTADLRSGATLQAGVALTGASKLTNNFNIATGTMIVGGTNDIELGGTLINSSGGASQTLSITNTGTTTLSGPVALADVLGDATQVLTVSVAPTAGTTTISGAITNQAGGGASTNAHGLTFTGGGTLTSSGNNTYTGVTTVGAGTLVLTGTNTTTGLTVIQSGGTLSVSSIANSLGTVSQINLGAGGASGRLLYTGAGESTNRVIGSTAGTGTPSGIIENAGSGTLTFTANTNFSNASNLPITLQGSAAGMFSGNIGASSGVGIISVNKAGANTWTLSGTNAYTGATTITDGTLSVSSLANGGTASNIGASTNAADRLVFNGGTLAYTGATQSTNRNFTINAGKTAIIDVTTGGSDLTFAGATGAATNGALTKNGPGTLTLTGANTYTGATTISAGTLQVGTGGTTGALASSSAITNNGTLAFNRSDALTQGNAISGTGGLSQLGAGTTTLTGAIATSGATAIDAGNLTFAGSAAIGNISVADSAALGVKVSAVGSSVITNANNPILTFGTAGATSFAVDFNSLGNPTVPVVNLGTGVLTLNGTVNVSLANTFGLTTTPNNTTLTLISYASQGGAGAFNLTTPTAGHSSFALNPTGTALYLDVTANPVTWTGALSNEWNDDTLASPKNWVLPGAVEADFITGDTVIFSNTASTFGVDLTEDVSPGSVTFTNTTNAYTIGATGAFGITSGLVTLNGSGQVTLNTANTYTGATTINAGTLTLNGSLFGSALTVGGSGTLAQTASGLIGGAASLTTSGTTTLAGANTYSLGTTVNAGTLNVDHNSALGTGAITINGGTLDSTAAGIVLSTNNAQNWNGDFTFTGTNSLDMGTGAVTVGGGGTDRTVTVSAGTLSVGELRAATHGLIKQGAGTLLLTSTGNSGNTDGSRIAGVLNAAAGTIQINRTGANTASSGDLTAAGVIGGGTITNGAAVARGLFSNPASGSFDFSGTLADGGSAGLVLFKSGAGTQILSGASTYTGGTTVSGGILKVQDSAALGTGVVTEIVRNAGVQLQGGISLPASVGFITSNDGTLDGTGVGLPAITNVSGNNTINGTITLTSGGGGSVIQSDSDALTLAGNITIAAGQTSRGIVLQGASTAANTFSGVLSDLSATSVASIVKTGTGTWTVSGANIYTGATTVSNGTLNLTGSLGGTPAAGTAGTAVSVASGATFAESAAGSIAGTRTFANAGTTTLAGANTYTGATTVTAGSLTVTGTLGNTAVGVSGGTLSLGNASAISQNTVTFSGTGTLTETVDNAIGGTASVFIQNSNVTLSRPNNYTGDTTINAGTGTTLTVTHALGAGSGRLNFASGSTTPLLNLHIDGGGTIAMPNYLGGNTGITSTIDVNNNGSGTGGVIQLTGTPGATTGYGNATLNVTGGNGYSLSLNGLINNAGSAGSATMNPTTANLMIGTYASNSTFAKTLVLGGTSSGNEVTGVIANGALGTVALTKSNTSTWTLSSTNTYTGATTVNGGTLIFEASQTLTSLSIGAGATVIFGENPAPAPALGGEEAVTVAALGAAAGSFDGAASIFGGASLVSTVPEPGAVGLLFAGALGLLARRRRSM